MRGGKRENAGRKPFQRKTKSKLFMIYEDQEPKIGEKGGSAYIRRLVDKDNEVKGNDKINN